MNLIKRSWFWLATITVAATLMPALGHAASFDCSKAEADHEIAICSDPRLSKQDEEMARMYRQAFEITPDKVQLRQQQRDWIERTRACGSDVECLSSYYDVRFDELRGYVNPLPDEEGTPQEAIAAPVAAAPPVATASEAQPVQNPPAVSAAGQKASIQAATSKAPETKANPFAMVILVGGSLTLLLIIVGCLIATKSLAEHSANKYGWNMILNWWNLLYIFGFFGAFFVGAIAVSGDGTSGPLAGLLFFCGIWAAMLVINIRKTSLKTGLAITLVQPFVVFIVYFLIQLAKGSSQRTHSR